MNKKTILYIGGFELPDKNAAAQRVTANAKILRELGYEVIFIGLDKTLDKNISLEKTKSIFDGFVYYQIKYPVSYKEWLHYLSDISFVKQFDPVCIIAYNYPALALEKLRRWTKSNHIKLIADCTEWYQPHGNIIFRIIKGLDIFFRMRIIHPKLDGIIAISSFLNEFYKNRGSRVIQIPPLVDLEQPKWHLQEEYTTSRVIRLIYVGSLGVGKDKLDIIIEALSILRDRLNIKYHFTIIGLTKEQFLKIYRHAGSIVAENDCVEFKGRLTHEISLEYIYNSDFQIFTRKNTRANMAGFPTKFVEAVSCGIPVLTNLTSDLKEYLKDNQNGFILDILTLDNLIETLSPPLQLSVEERINLKKKCREIRNEFDYQKYIPEFKKFLNAILL